MVGREYIELLAPAREAEHGIEAIKYGADAVRSTRVAVIAVFVSHRVYGNDIAVSNDAVAGDAVYHLFIDGYASRGRETAVA